MNPQLTIWIVLIWTGFCQLSTSCGPASTESPSSLFSGGIRKGQLKGYVVLNQIIHERLLQQVPHQPHFSLGSYVGIRGTQLRGLALLFGGFSGVGPANRYRNGIPNPLNTLLWDLVLTAFAKDCSKQCRLSPDPLGADDDTNLPPFILNEVTKSTLMALCAWPNRGGPHGTESSMNQLWDLLMGPNDLDEEKTAWKDFFLKKDSPFANKGAEETVATMLRLILLNPYFILEVD
jgi:hypothetical protein